MNGPFEPSGRQRIRHWRALATLASRSRARKPATRGASLPTPRKPGRPQPTPSRWSQGTECRDGAKVLPK